MASTPVAMPTASRSSIMNRPVHKLPPRGNVENLEAEYQRSVALLKAKQQRYTMQVDSLTKSIFSTSQERRHMQVASKQEQSEALEAKRQQQLSERAQDKQFAEKIKEQQTQCDQMLRNHNAERRAYAAQVMRENQELMLEKQRSAAERKRQEAEADKNRGPSFFDRIPKSFR